MQRDVFISINDDHCIARESLFARHIAEKSTTSKQRPGASVEASSTQEKRRRLMEYDYVAYR